MTYGVTVEVGELIGLRRIAQRVQYDGNALASRTGMHIARLRGRGMEFLETRHYQAGDDSRHIEWRVTARTGRPHVKVFHEERERPVVIVVDFRPSMHFGTRVAFKSVVAARLAAILAWTVAKQGDRVGGLIFSDTCHHVFTPRGRQAGVLPLLSGLSHYTQRAQVEISSTPNSSSLNQALLRVQRVVKPGSTIVILSDFYALDSETERVLNRLHQHNDVLAYHVCDPLECAPPSPTHHAFTDGIKALDIDTSLDSVRFGYQYSCDRRLGSIKSMFKKTSIQCSMVNSMTDLAALVRQTFPWGAHG